MKEMMSMPQEQPMRVLEGAEREKMIAELEEFISGLAAALEDPDLPEEDRAEMQAQLDGCQDSLEAARAGGDFKVAP